MYCGYCSPLSRHQTVDQDSGRRSSIGLFLSSAHRRADSDLLSPAVGSLFSPAVGPLFSFLLHSGARQSCWDFSLFSSVCRAVHDVLTGELFACVQQHHLHYFHDSASLATAPSIHNMIGEILMHLMQVRHRPSVFCGASRRCARPLSAHRKEIISTSTCVCAATAVVTNSSRARLRAPSTLSVFHLAAHAPT